MPTPKNVLIALAVVAAGLSAACSADSATDYGDGFGAFVGRWDGERWNGRGYAVLSRDTLFLFGHRRPVANQFYDEQVSVVVAFAGSGRYEVESQALLGKVTGGDAGYFATASGLLLIDRADIDRRRLRGRLELEGQGQGGVWRFTDGEVDVLIYFDFGEAPPFY